MTPTEKGRRVDALNQGPDTRRVLCEMVANRESDLEELTAENASLKNAAELLRAMLSQKHTEKWCYMAENARLREERDMYRDLVGMMDHPDLNAQFQAENAKLREIIADLEELLPKSERWYSHETVKAIAEDNAKLRKLLLDVWNDAMRFDGFWDYVMDDGEIYNEDELPHYQERMRELGIEVN